MITGQQSKKRSSSAQNVELVSIRSILCVFYRRLFPDLFTMVYVFNAIQELVWKMQRYYSVTQILMATAVVDGNANVML
jgi:hypothetical protein